MGSATTAQATPVHDQCKRICCPYGRCLTAIIPCIIFAAWMCNNMAAFHCRFVLVAGGIGLGFWNIEDSYSCESWPESMNYAVDGAWKFGRALGVLLNIIGALVFGLFLMISCVEVPQWLIWVLRSSLFGLGLCSLLLLVGLSSKVCYETCYASVCCTFGPGAALAIAGACLYTGTGIAACFLRPREFHDDNDEPLPIFASAPPETAPSQISAYTTQPGGVLSTTRIEITEQVNQDGTMKKITKKVTTNLDGSSTKEEKVEVIHMIESIEAEPIPVPAQTGKTL